MLQKGRESQELLGPSAATLLFFPSTLPSHDLLILCPVFIVSTQWDGWLLVTLEFSSLSYFNEIIITSSTMPCFTSHSFTFIQLHVQGLRGVGSCVQPCHLVLTHGPMASLWAPCCPPNFS